MNWKGCERQQRWPNSRSSVVICLQGLNETMKTLGYNSLYSSRVLNLDIPNKYKFQPLDVEARDLFGSVINCLMTCAIKASHRAAHVVAMKWSMRRTQISAKKFVTFIK
jgi:hypothetical protein